MLLFTRLAEFKQDVLARLRDKRRAKRYPVGPEFPLKARVTLADGDGARGKAPTTPANGRDWSGRLANFSATGVSLRLPAAAISARGEKTKVVLTLEGYELPIDAEVAHFRVYHSHSICGFKLAFSDARQQTAYLQLLEAVVIGACFAPHYPTGFVRNPPGLVREQYRSEHGATLSAWRQASDERLDSFELLMNEHLVRGEAARPRLDVYTKQPGAKGGKVAFSSPGFSFSNGAHAEVRQLFRWVVPNLPESLPRDLRGFLARFAKEEARVIGLSVPPR